MVRKILEDVKVNNHKAIKTFKDDVIIKSTPIVKTILKQTIKPITDTGPEREELKDKTYHNEESKYEFLEKKKVSSPEYYHSEKMLQTPHMKTKKSRPFNKPILLIFILALVIAVFYLFSTVFYKANITIIPKNKIFDLKNESFASSKKSGIPFEVMIVEDTLNKEVVLTSSKEVTNKAKGEIILYNEYAKTPQKITVGSFVTDEYGKSYKIDGTVNIPGYTVDKAAKIIPGQVAVGVTSFIAGEAYNGSPKSFYITSFKNTDKYKKIYGKLKAPLSGGIAGLVYTVDDKEKELILGDVSTSKERLIKKLNALVPPGYILYPNAVNFSYDLGESTFSKIPNAKLDVKGTLKAVLLKKDLLSSYIVDRILPDISKIEKLEIVDPDLNSLTFNFKDKEQIIAKEMESFDFELTGSLSLDWNPNTEGLKVSLLGKDKSEVPSIFKIDPGISSASVSIIPFWASKLPDTQEKINIIIKK